MSSKPLAIALAIACIIGGLLASITLWNPAPNQQGGQGTTTPSPAGENEGSQSSRSLRPAGLFYSLSSYSDLLDVIASRASLADLQEKAKAYMPSIAHSGAAPVYQPATATQAYTVTYTYTYGNIPASTPAEGIAPATGAPEHSTTNIQVTGVDEPELVKTDGYYIYVCPGDSRVYIVRSYPINETGLTAVVDVARDLGIPSNETQLLHIDGIFVSGNRLVAVATKTIPAVLIYGRLVEREGPVQPTTYLLVYNITSRSSPVLDSVVKVSGDYFTARMIGDTAYLFTEYYIPVYWIMRAGEEVKPETIVPRINGAPIPPADILVFNTSITDLWYSYFLTIMAYNTSSHNHTAISILMPYTSYVYVSRENIYLAAYASPLYTIWDEIYRRIADKLGIVLGMAGSIDDLFNKYSELPDYQRAVIRGVIEDEIRSIYLNKTVSRTLLVKLSIKGLTISYNASAEVPGYVTDQFSMDEYKGMFRIATTSTIITDVRISESLLVWYTPNGTRAARAIVYPDISMTTANNVYVLDSSLNIIGSIEGIEPGERIYSTRFLGDLCLLVTYRRIDPLYAIDLSDPRHPRIIGFLKTLGYSEYLHPIGDGLLLGIGVEANEYGWERGLKISLYNISDPTNITEASRIILPYARSLALYNYRLFVYNPTREYFMVPVAISGLHVENTMAQIITPNKTGLNMTSRHYTVQGLLVVSINGTRLIERFIVIPFTEPAGVYLIRGVYIGDYVIAIGARPRELALLFIDYNTGAQAAYIKVPTKATEDTIIFFT